MTAVKQQISKKSLHGAAGLLACLLLSGLAAAQSSANAPAPVQEPTNFIEVLEDQRGQAQALQVAIVRYVPRDSSLGYSVDLVSAVHIADQQYYRALSDRFVTYDALLYELVAAENRTVPPPGAEASGVISGLQASMKDLLGLSFQLDEIDYTADNFVHADLSPSQLKQSMVDRGESLYVYFWRVFFASMQQYANDPLGVRDRRLLAAILQPDDGVALRAALAYELANNDALGGALDGEDGSAIIDSRNERAIEVLKEQIALGQKKLAIFYGVAHMPDFEERLLAELDLVKQDTTWLPAWDLRAYPAGEE